MNTRKIVLGAVLVIIGLPVVLVLIVVVSIHVLNRTNGAIISAGQKREYLLYVPRSYDRAKPTPLMISMHAAALWPAQQMNLSGWNRLAESQGFIVVYPSGSDTPKIWHVDSGAGLMRDVRFISELIDTLEAAYNIDPTRIYADGVSNGGGMAFVLSCALSDRIAAVGMVAAARSLPWSWCTDHRAVPMITFHGTADPIAPYNGGPRSRASPKPFPSVSTWAANWARGNRCGPNPIESVVAADVTRVEYTKCADDAAVVFYTLRGGGHAWPGAKPKQESFLSARLVAMNQWLLGPTNRNIDATSQMWAFFREHPLPRK